MIEQSTITCPKCGHAATERMPTDACQFFYDCKGYGERLKPKPGRLLRVLLLRLGAMPAGSSLRMLSMTGTLHTARRAAQRLPHRLQSRGGAEPVEAADHSKYLTLPQNSASSRP